MIIAQITQIKVQTRISNGQWSIKIILDKFIKIKNGNKVQNVFLYQNKYKAIKNQTEIQAWSEGKDDSGIFPKTKCFVASGIL